MKVTLGEALLHVMEQGGSRAAVTAVGAQTGIALLHGAGFLYSRMVAKRDVYGSASHDASRQLPRRSEVA